MSEDVRTFIYADIEREINLARNGQGGGNLLAGLGLLCYTEFLGGLKRGGVFKAREARRNFDAGFTELGPHYGTFLTKHLVYDIFRCGMVHEYATKRSCYIAMLAGPNAEGIGEHPDRSQGYEFYFCVEAYFRDFRAAYERIVPPSSR